MRILEHSPASDSLIIDLTTCMVLADFLGSVAALLTTMAFVPQVAQCLRSRDLSAISLPMYSIFSLGVFLWLVYGVLIASAPVVVANLITLSLSLTILALKIREQRKQFTSV